LYEYKQELGFLPEVTAPYVLEFLYAVYSGKLGKHTHAVVSFVKLVIKIYREKSIFE
jgi:hypothetical protein